MTVNCFTTVASFSAFPDIRASREAHMPRPSVVTGVRFLFGRGADIAFVTVGPYALDGNGDLGEAFLLDALGVTQRGRQRRASPTVSSFVTVTAHWRRWAERGAVVPVCRA